MTNAGGAGGSYRVLAGAKDTEGGAGIAGKMDALKQEAEHLKNDIRVSEGSAKKDPRPQSILITMLSSCFPSRQELRLEETSRRMVMDVWWAVQHV